MAVTVRVHPDGKGSNVVALAHTTVSVSIKDHRTEALIVMTHRGDTVVAIYRGGLSVHEYAIPSY